MLAHGRESTNNEIAGMVRGLFGRTTQKNMTAASLAKQRYRDASYTVALFGFVAVSPYFLDS